jgi:hypothetical protein
VGQIPQQNTPLRTRLCKIFDDVPDVGKATKQRLENHDYISITTGEQIFGIFLYKTRPGSTRSAPRTGRCDEFKTWLTNDYSVQGKVADKMLEACMQKVEKVCIHAAGRGHGRVSGSGSGSQSTCHTTMQPVRGMTEPVPA